MISFFFFQAEDGIRDADVTGVQTCALPISLCWTGPWKKCLMPSAPWVEQGLFPNLEMMTVGEYLTRGVTVRGSCSIPLRSEERRVGKECRSRWSPYH